MRNTPERLDHLVERLSVRNTQKWHELHVQQQSESSQNVLRGLLFDDHYQEADFDALFELALDHWPSSGIERNEHLTGDFRKWIIGKDDRESRARIFASLLRCGTKYLSEAWQYLLREFQTGSQPDFLDQHMPIAEATAETIFPTSLASGFLESQYEFCPVSCDDIEVDYYKVAEELRNVIETEAVCRCETTGKDGEKSESPSDSWYPLARLQHVLNQHDALIKNLYIGWRWRAHTGLPQDARTRHEYKQEVHTKAATFKEASNACPMTFATILFSLPPEQELWRQMMESFETGLHLFPDSDENADDMLPLKWPIVVKEVAEDRYQHAFFDAQFRFKPFNFRGSRNTSSDEQWPHEKPPSLPLYQKEFYGEGAFGEVWRISGDRDYFDSDTPNNGQLAMKIINAQDTTMHTEWHLAQSLHGDETSGDNAGLLVPTAMLRTDSKVYILMPLADCNLRALMYCRDRRRAYLGDQQSVSQEIKDQEEHHRLLVPQTHADRKGKLRWLLGPAKGLRRLHHDGLWKGEHHVKVRHGDVKSSNVLYTRARGDSPLQLADFGISAFKYQARSSSDTDTGEVVALSELNPNFAPELEQDGKGGFGVDLWGFGTLFAEFVAWISGGRIALTAFAAGRDQEENTGQYYCRANGIAIIKPGIVKWFESLIAETTDAKDKVLYQDCWHLLRHGLLACQPDERISADRLCDALACILEGKSKGLKKLVPVRDQSSDLGSPPPRGDTPTERPTPSGTPAPIMNDPADADFLVAVRNREVARALELINKDMEIGSVDESGETPLHCAVKCRSVELTERLLKDHPGCSGSVNNDGQTALHVCVKSDHNSALRHAEKLLRHDSSLLNRKDRRDRTALQYAQELRKGSMHQLLKRWSSRNE